MLKKMKSIICYLLTLAMLLTLLPPQAYEASTSVNGTVGTETTKETTGNGTSLQAPVTQGNTISMDDTIPVEDAEIVMELEERRTEYSKEFKLDNGLNLAVVYSEPVHYKENGSWKEIDNTLKAHGSGKSASYKNTAGSWQVEFPQQMDDSSAVRITKGNYAVSFTMAEEIRLEIGTEEARLAEAVSVVSNARKGRGQAHTFDYSKQKSQAKHPEVLPDKLRSRMSYSDVYNNTDIIYDLEPYQVKESIVINEYNPSVYGYVYTLDTGKLVPVLKEDGSIDLKTSKNGEVIMTMPAPFMIDDAGEVCLDVAVTLEKEKGNGTYRLTYLLPMEWMQDESRVWPVVLDPIVKTEPGTATNNILDHFVAENYSKDRNHGYLYAGHHTTYGDMRTFLRFSEIPDLTAAEVIVNATLKLNYVDGSTHSVIIEAHQVTESWETGTITWDNQPDFNPIVQDYCSVSNAAEFSWDITDIAYSWYLGENYGVVLKGSTAVETSSAENWKRFYSVDHSKTNQDIWPYLELTYQTAQGLEDYWDYTTTSAGRAGNGYINNYTGNMTWVHSDLGFDGNLMPVSISHIYTLSERNETTYGLGKGWRTNFHQTVKKADSGDYYIWTDGDGTKHHFNSTSTTGTYKDEDGLRLTLTVTSSSYTITDIYGNTSNFDSNGRLISMVNNQSTTSQITITYNGTTNRIATITDGVGRLYKFTYNSSNLLTQIGYHGNNGAGGTEITNVQFTYNSSSKLTKITYKDGLDSHFTYDGTKLLTAMDIDDYKVQFSYTTGITKRIAGIEEFDGSKKGNEITIEYAHNKAKISDVEHTVIHRYNDFGNLVSTQDEEGNGEFYEYMANKYTETSPYGNLLTLASKQQTTVVNLLDYNSFESGSVFYAASSASIGRTTSKAYMGNYALQVISNTSAVVVRAYGAAISIPAKQTCTFSAYVQSEDVLIQLGLGTASSAYVKSETYESTGEWKRLEVSYTNPNDSAVSVYPLVIVGDAGTAYVDCVQAEISSGAGRYNLIENGDFRTTGYWSASNGRTTVSESAAPQLDTTAYWMNGNPSGTQSISQTIMVSGKAWDEFVLSGWAKGNPVPLNSTIRQFGLRITFNHIDGSSNSTLVSFRGDYDAEGDWQYTAGRVVPWEDYNSVEVELVYYYNMNNVWFDGIGLYKENFGERYIYNADGNVSSVTDVLGLKTTYQYSNNDPVKIVEASGLTTENGYSNHNLTSSRQYYTDPETGNKIYCGNYFYSYDAYGNQTRQYSEINFVVKQTFATYSSDHNYLVTTTDELGNVTTYGYDSQTGVLLYVKYPKDTDATRTEYDYDDMYRLESTTVTTNQNKTMSVGYGYSNDLLTQVTTGSSVYNFTYGDFALRTKVAVGSTTLARYTYTDDAYHRLASVTYGNGDKVEYTYDDLGRVTKEIYKENGSTTISRTITYEYNSSGALATVKDSKTGITTKHYYDTGGRSTGMYESGAGSSHHLKYSYDALGRLQKATETCGNSTYTTEYSYYGNGQVSAIKAGSSTETYVYDEYNRLDKWYTYHGSSTTALITKNIHYEKPNDESTSSRPEVWSYDSAGEYDVHYNYSYDANGNIISETVGGKKTTYVYDSANQLIRENNQAAGTTWVYTYDDAGNILSKTEYGYTTGALGNPDETYTYTYGNSNWGDLLTNYNGANITYDAIGNPLNDGTWTYTWQEGRKLATMSQSGITWTYTYDTNGMRTERTTGSTTYNYTYHGSQLTHMTYGSNVLHFYYDASGKPLSVVYNGVTYYYVLNLQGDVVALLDSTGDMAVEYRYDAWGRLLDVSGDLEFTLGLHNPLRYRGYVYDRETGLYYLQSRYYNPEIGRFINEDSLVSTGQGILGYNMFAYCNNNPVNKIDETGKLGLAIGIFIGVSAVIGGIAGAFTAACTGGNVVEGLIEGTALGAVAATATVLAPVLLSTASAVTTIGATFVLAGAGGMAVDYITQRVSHALSEKSNEEFVLDTGRLVKTGVMTGIAGVVPTYGKPGDSVVNALGSLVMGFDASFFNAAMEVAITHFLK